jgi:hypothetical protein
MYKIFNLSFVEKVLHTKNVQCVHGIKYHFQTKFNGV